MSRISPHDSKLKTHLRITKLSWPATFASVFDVTHAHRCDEVIDGICSKGRRIPMRYEKAVDGSNHFPSRLQAVSKMVIVSNNMLALPDESAAQYNRMLALNFTQRFLGKEDTGLSEKLRRELPGTLLWAIQGYDRLRARGRSPSQCVDCFLSTDSRKAVL